MTKEERERINEYLDKAYDGVHEYAEELLDTCVITDWLGKIYEVVNKEE